MYQEQSNRIARELEGKKPDERTEGRIINYKIHRDIEIEGENRDVRIEEGSKCVYVKKNGDWRCLDTDRETSRRKLPGHNSLIGPSYRKCPYHRKPDRNDI